MLAWSDLVKNLSLNGQFVTSLLFPQMVRKLYQTPWICFGQHCRRWRTRILWPTPTFASKIKGSVFVHLVKRGEQLIKTCKVIDRERLDDKNNLYNRCHSTSCAAFLICFALYKWDETETLLIIRSPKKCDRRTNLENGRRQNTMGALECRIQTQKQNLEFAQSKKNGNRVRSFSNPGHFLPKGFGFFLNRFEIR